MSTVCLDITLTLHKRAILLGTWAEEDDSKWSGMAKGHPIAVVAERTGLSRDVIRAWERRYGVVEPSRTAGRQRSYSDAEIARLSLLAAATRLRRPRYDAPRFADRYGEAGAALVYR